MDNSYYKFGINQPVPKDVSDPVQSCLVNSKYFSTANPLRFDAELCGNFMTQRCASKWDDKCDEFLKQSADKYVPFNVGSLPPSEFIEIVARKKYCMLDKDDPNAKCVELCEPMNPVDQTSVQVCSIYGTEIYQDQQHLQDIAGDFPATAKLRNVSPIKITKCPVLCNGVDKIEKDDKVIDMCLTTGRCMDVMQQLAEYAKKNNITVDNEKFKKYMEYYTALVPEQKKLLSENKASILVPDTPTETPTAVPSSFSIPQSFSSSNIPQKFKAPSTFDGKVVDHNYIKSNYVQKNAVDIKSIIMDNKCMILGVLFLIIILCIYYCKSKK
jgi:hypothetical protein